MWVNFDGLKKKEDEKRERLKSQLQKEQEEAIYEPFDEAKAYSEPPTQQLTPEQAELEEHSLFHHVKQKVWEHQVISLGLVLTVGSWLMMVRNRYDSAKLNYWGRWRVSLQGVTFGALVYAMYQDESRYHSSPYPWDWKLGQQWRTRLGRTSGSPSSSSSEDNSQK